MMGNGGNIAGFQRARIDAGKKEGGITENSAFQPQLLLSQGPSEGKNIKTPASQLAISRLIAGAPNHNILKAVNNMDDAAYTQKNVGVSRLRPRQICPEESLGDDRR